MISTFFSSRNLFLKNIATCISPAKNSLKVLNNIDIEIDNGIITAIGNFESPSNAIDASGLVVTPGFVDPHTHLFPPKLRSNEFNQRAQGKTYQEIADLGGGILSSVSATRNATEDEIFNFNKPLIKNFINQGVTTLEVKSGYGLSVSDELKQLNVINRLNQAFPSIDIIPTCLAAHAIPPEFKQTPEKYISLICDELLPKVAEQNLAEYVDVFCEIGYFSVQQSRKILSRALDLGLRIRLHADEFQDSGAAELAAELGADSADHLMAISPKGMDSLLKSNVVATVLPGTTLFLGSLNFAPMKEMVQKGLTVALASDFNPGSSVYNSPAFMMQLAMTHGKLSFDDALRGVTQNAALSLNRPNLGLLEPGYQADLLLWDISDPHDIPYLGTTNNRLCGVIKRGEYYPLPINSTSESIKGKDSVKVKGKDSVKEFLDSFSQCSMQDGLITKIPIAPPLNPDFNHPPKRHHSLTPKEQDLAVSNALKYIHPDLHPQMKQIFQSELKDFGHIYGFNFLPQIQLSAIPFKDIPGKNNEARAMIHMILNNLDPQVAQYPQELITYGGNGAVFSNWMQFHKTLKLLTEMDTNQCLSMVSGHPQGLFPKNQGSPSAIITNGMMIPNYSDRHHLDNLYALGTTMYGQMTAGSWMYIGPQGIVHGTHEIVKLAAAKQNPDNPTLQGKIFVTSGLGGMSGAQPKATSIAGGICMVAEIDRNALLKRHKQGWLDETFTSLESMIKRAKHAKKHNIVVSLGYEGNIVDLLEALGNSDLSVELISDQTSLHNPFNGGYYPVGLTFDESKQLMNENPKQFQAAVEKSLIRHVEAINRLTDKGSFFWDYGNAFLLEASRASAPLKESYKSYVETMMGPELFDNGFGPYRWVVTSGKPEELALTDQIAAKVIRKQLEQAPPRVSHQLQSNLDWVERAGENHLTVGSQARILYSDLEGRINLALAMNNAIGKNLISSPIVIGRDHHDVSGTDSPYRETANILDGSNLTADMAVQNVIGDAMRGASWVSLHNGGGVGWGEVVNGGFGLVLDGTEEMAQRAQMMLFWDVANGLVRRARAGNPNALATITELADKYPDFVPFIPGLNQ